MLPAIPMKISYQNPSPLHAFYRKPSTSTKFFIIDQPTLCKLCAVQARICSTNQKSSVQVRNVVKIRHIISTSEDVHYEQGTSSIQARMRIAYITEQIHEIRFVCMVCVIARCILSRIVVYKLIMSRKTVHVASVHIYHLRAATYSYPKMFFFLKS